MKKLLSQELGTNGPKIKEHLDSCKNNYQFQSEELDIIEDLKRKQAKNAALKAGSLGIKFQTPSKLTVVKESSDSVTPIKIIKKKTSKR